MSATDKPLLLMLGDSLIDYGEWHRLLPGYRIISSGIPGERTEGLLYRLPPELDGDSPDGIVIMSGTNNIVFGDLVFVDLLGRVATILRSHYRQAEIVFTSLLPYEIPGLLDVIYAANQQLAFVCEEHGCRYFDLCSHFEQSFEELFDFDGVHLSNLGYRLWAARLDEYLRKLLAKPPD
jgi:lysophospholipase L1-like esterase